MRNLRFALVAFGAALLCLGLGTPSAVAEPEPDVSTMIIGGEEATEPYSFMVSLQKEPDGHFCGGSLIAAEWVVTALHCLDAGTKPEDVRLRIGSLNRGEGGSVRGAKRIVLNPEGNPGHFDIALVQLDAPVSNTPIPMDVRQSAGAPVRMLGWGCTAPSDIFFGCAGGRPTMLRQLDSAVRDSGECVSVTLPMEADHELCTGNPDTKAGACIGDSGGPLIRRTADGWRLDGAFSRVEVRTDPHDVDCTTGLGIYTDVTVHKDWIESVISAA
ncbi:serine protease [Actinomadura meridiana]|uniref:Serine protease n=1 Tax=Actinomadura meridiana TaxID=559626 RepID=A0ABP8CN42_9ACTN